MLAACFEASARVVGIVVLVELSHLKLIRDSSSQRLIFTCHDTLIVLDYQGVMTREYQIDVSCGHDISKPRYAIPALHIISFLFIFYFSA